MDVSIIIVNYNTKQLLSNCLDSIQTRTTDISYEVIVVDNDSADGSQELIKQKYPWVRLIESKENLGFGKANNLGMEHAKGKYFFLLNSDTILLNNAIKIFYDYSMQHPGFGALGAILLDAQKKPCHSYGNLITPSSEIKFVIAKYLRFLKDKSLLNPNQVKSPLSVGYITGADLWLKRQVFEELGGFDPDYFMYCEEVDWQKRMADANLPRIIIPGPEIIHLEGGSDPSKSRIWSNSRLKNIHKSKNIYYKKHFNQIEYLYFKILYSFLNIPNILLLKTVTSIKR